MVEVSQNNPVRPNQTVYKSLKKLILTSAISLLIVSTTAGFLGGWLAARSSEQNDSNSIKSSQKIVSSESQLISQIAKDVGPSVVSINVTSTAPQTDSVFGFTQQVQQESAGTGLIISESGIVLTNRHVVPAGTTDVSVTLSDGTELNNVEVIGRTSATDPLDVAYLKIKDTKGKVLKAAKLGDSSKVQVGDKVIAIGNALGQFQNTVTSGIISGFGRNLRASDSNGNSSETLQNLFQTDAAINEGNSGGPLVNLNGEVIGLNTALAGAAQNIGFALPINDIQGLNKSVLEQGKLLRPYLGVHYISITDDVAYQLNLSVKRGAYIAPSSGGVASIISGSPAQKAGLQEKDIITKVDGVAVDQTNSLTSLLGQKSVNDTVILTVLRSGKTISVMIKLEAAPTG
ncbi:MAG TPA: trypsin-like peptidase domain-containing protein [Candidatus Saccharimonadales bacterium]|nr:trypsin-like peptidase domain-containing protein [Candidatus Saccharimonadales bacterium]